MLYRIDYQNFLLHAIDYLTLKELISGQYCLVSAKVKNIGRLTNVVTNNNVYPTPEMIDTYVRTEDKEIFYNMYKKFMDESESGLDSSASMFKQDVYRTFVKPVLSHYDVWIVADRSENDYIDLLVRYIKESFKLECIDLNTLFQKGKVGPIYIDRDKIHDRSVKLAREITRAAKESLATTAEGREKLIGIMNKKEKIAKLNELGITPTENDDIDELLRDAWNDE